jgi:hypothetical protein
VTDPCGYTDFIVKIDDDHGSAIKCTSVEDHTQPAVTNIVKQADK